MNQNIIDLIDKLKLNYSGYNYENFEFNDQSILIIDTIMKNKIIEHNAYIREYGEDMPEVKNWKWES